MTKTVGFIGGGHMTRSIIAGLSQPVGKGAPIQLCNVWVYDRNPDKLSSMRKEFGINAATDNEELIKNSEAVVLSVKPQVLKKTLNPLASLMRRHQSLIVSLAAGIRSESIDTWLGENFAIVRAMPNMASAIGYGATGMFANHLVRDEQKLFSAVLMDAVGITHWVDRESDIDLVTALSGSGPAYFMLLIDHLINSAVSAGLDPQAARLLALQTARGTAELIEGSDKSIASLIDSICLAGGTTEQAVGSFREDKIGLVVARAFDAAKTRAEQLENELSA